MCERFQGYFRTQDFETDFSLADYNDCSFLEARTQFEDY